MPTTTSSSTASGLHTKAAIDHETAAKQHHKAAECHDKSKLSDAKDSAKAAMGHCTTATKSSEAACALSAK